MQIQIDAHFFSAFDEIKPVHACNARFTVESVRRAVRNIADKAFFADGRGVVKSFGDINLLAANIFCDVRSNRINNHAENFLRVELQTAGIFVDKSLAVANIINDIFGRGLAIEYGVGERNFFVGRDFGEFALEFVEINFLRGGQRLQELWLNGFMVTVGELAHFINRRAQIIGMRLKRQPQRLKPVENARQLAQPAVVNVFREVVIKIFLAVANACNGFRVLNQ